MNGFQSNKKFFNLLDKKAEKSDLNNPFEGGVHIDAGGMASYALWEEVSAGTNNFSVSIRVRRTGDAAGSIISSLLEEGLTIIALANGAVEVLKNGSAAVFTTAAGVLPLNEEVVLIYSRASGTGTLYANGTSVGAGSDANNYRGYLSMGAGISTLGFIGILREFCGYNRDLSLAEVADITAGRPVPSLAFPAGTAGNVTPANGRFGFVGSSGYSAVSGVAGTSPAPSITGTFGIFSGATFTPQFMATHGQFVRVLFEVSGYSGDGTGALGLFSDTSPYSIGIPAVTFFTGNGTYELISKVGTLPPGASFRLSVENPFASGSWTGTVSILALEYLGEAFAFRAGDVVRSGRWRDSSGNNNDLVPLLDGIITALYPAESYTRVFSGTISATLPGLDAGGFNEVAPFVSGPTPESLAAIQSVRQGDLCHIAFDTEPPESVSLRAALNAPADGQVRALLTATDANPITLTNVPVTIAHLVK